MPASPGIPAPEDNRRLVREYDHRPRSSESREYWAMTDVMTRWWLTSATVLAWRDA